MTDKVAAFSIIYNLLHLSSLSSSSHFSLPSFSSSSLILLLSSSHPNLIPGSNQKEVLGFWVRFVRIEVKTGYTQQRRVTEFLRHQGKRRWFVDLIGGRRERMGEETTKQEEDKTSPYIKTTPSLGLGDKNFDKC